MRIVIDLQGAQSPANGKRGIGRYASSLTEAIARAAQGHELVLALNGQFGDAVDQVMEKFDGLVERKNFRVWHAPRHEPTASSGIQRAQEKLYEAFLASLQPDVVHISSLFEGLGDASTTSIGAFQALPTAVTLYDLIPLIHPRPYLDDPRMRAWYLRKVSALRRADLWLAISESSRQEGIEHLGLDADRCINVSTAADPQFRRLEMSPGQELALRTRYGLHRPFIMYTGGIDHRKNLDGLIRAFAMVPAELRGRHQLAIVCSASQQDRESLLALARRQGMADGDVVVTGFVPDADLVELYNTCALFVFPSWHEGFGLPALEAMHCGAVVIGSDTSSIPEVIGRDDALFAPKDDAAIAAKITQALTDEDFRASLVEHGLRQATKFSWDASARRAIEGFEALHATRKEHVQETRAPGFRRLRPKLAYVSPLPPQRSGIASYSAELLPELAQHYDIELISDLDSVEDPLLAASFPLRATAWFRENHASFDRVLYHFGNSEFHQHMFDLLAEIPGVVVLHDFFLSGAEAHREMHGGQEFSWTESLYESHGYPAVAERYSVADLADIVFKYPCNFPVLRQAQGVIVHSRHSVELAQAWYPDSNYRDWEVVPLLRVAPQDVAELRQAARDELGLKAHDFLVCAFGLLGPTKLNHRLLDAWKNSALASSAECRLVFVGENDPGPYGKRIDKDVAALGKSKVSVTGWASDEVFHRYLAAADVAVQLRTQSRGESSGAVLDAMSHGLAAIVNASGFMASLPQDAVLMLPEEFSDQDLTRALERLWREPSARVALGAHGRQSIRSLHTPTRCAQRYAQAIERFAARAAMGRDGLIEAAQADGPFESPHELADALELASAIASTLPMPASARQLFVDVSELVQRDAKTGIQRVVKSLLRALLDAPPAGFRIEPVYATLDRPGYRYAREFMARFLGCPPDALEDAALNVHSGDVFVGLDLQPHVVPEQIESLRRLRHAGVRIEFVVYDLLPILLSDRFAPGAAEVHARWLKAIALGDGAICISRAVAAELASWMADHLPEQQRRHFKIRSFQLGADLGATAATAELPRDAESTLASISSRPAFLMVGTVEPRKGQRAALEAFEQLWAQGVDASLVIVGKQGWMVDDLVERLTRHRELGGRLFWITNASDAYLERLYAAAACLLVPSEGEGFGLPLIEGAKHGLPILARRIPVFVEVADTHAYYFEGDPASLAASIVDWLALLRRGTHPHSEKMPYLTWQQSAEAFKAALFNGSS